MARRLHPIWNPHLKLPRDILKELSSGRDRVLFTSYTDLQIWYERILDALSLQYVDEPQRENYPVRPELIWSVHSAVRCVWEDPRMKMSDLLEASHLKANRRELDLSDGKRLRVVDDQAVLQLLSRAFPRNPADGIDPEGVFFVDVNREDNPRQPDWYDLTPSGRAAFYHLQTLIDNSDKAFRRRVMRTVWEEYGLPEPSTPEFFGLWCAAHRDASIVTPSEDDWTALAALMPKPARFAPRGYGIYYSTTWRSGFGEAVCDILEQAYEQCLPIESMNVFLDAVEGVRRSVLNDVSSEFNLRAGWSWNRLPILHAAIFQREHPKRFQQERVRINRLLKASRIAELKEGVGRSVPTTLAFVRRFYDSRHALTIPERETGRPIPPSKGTISAYLIEIHNLIRNLGIKRPGYWTVHITNALADREIYSETPFDNQPLSTEDQEIDLAYARRHGWVVHGERSLDRDLQLARKRYPKCSR